MRYIKPLVCLTACLYLLTSCGGDPEPIETDLSPAQMAAAIINSQDYEQDFIFATPGQDIYELLISASYAVPDGYITDGAICYLDGVEASEIAVLSVDNEDHMAEVQACLSEYLLGRAASFTGYAPKQAAMAEAGVVESIGNYAVMLICEDPTGARDAFLDCFDPETQQNTDYTFASVEHPKPLKNPQITAMPPTQHLLPRLSPVAIRSRLSNQNLRNRSSHLSQLPQSPATASTA